MIGCFVRRARASTEPPTVIGGEGLHPRSHGRGGRAASTEPPTVIGGEVSGDVGRLNADDPRFNGAADGDRRRGSRGGGIALGGYLASTEPPTVIGGEAAYAIGARGRLHSASTEPPTVIGGEALQFAIQVDQVACFNGAADGDRRRGRPSRCSRAWPSTSFNGAADGDRRRGFVF